MLYRLRGKFSWFSLILFIIIGSLAGCASKEDSLKYDESDNSSTSIPSEAIDCGPIVASTYGTVALTDKGAYLIEQHGAGFVNLMYADFSTQSKIFVCANPSCGHNTEACSS